jgi:hypothetical protein
MAAGAGSAKRPTQPPRGAKQGPPKPPAETVQARRRRLLGSAYMRCTLAGEVYDYATGDYASHKPGCTCHSRLWDSGPAEATGERTCRLRSHLTRFLNLSNEKRTAAVFGVLADKYYADLDGNGLPTGPKRWHYWLNHRYVCKAVFLAAYPVSRRTLDRIKQRIKLGYSFAHPKHEEGGASASAGDPKGASMIGWVLGYASEVGDYMPDKKQLVIPRRPRLEDFDECAAALGQLCGAYSYFCAIMQDAPELAHITYARKLLNFQACASPSTPPLHSPSPAHPPTPLTPPSPSPTGMLVVCAAQRGCSKGISH